MKTFLLLLLLTAGCMTPAGHATLLREGAGHATYRISGDATEGAARARALMYDYCHAFHVDRSAFFPVGYTTSGTVVSTFALDLTFTCDPVHGSQP
jgi:hypothetical protein